MRMRTELIFKRQRRDEMARLAMRVLLAAGLLGVTVSVTGCNSVPRFKAYKLDSTARSMNAKHEFLVRQPDGSWGIADLQGNRRSITGIPANSVPQALNDRGDVAGVLFIDADCRADTGGHFCHVRPFLVKEGVVHEFSGVGVWASVTSLNNEGDLGGGYHAGESTDLLPFVVLGGKVVLLEPPAPYANGSVVEMNKSGQGVGTLWDGNHDHPHGFMEIDGKLTLFPNLDGNVDSLGTVVDDQNNFGGAQRRKDGQVVIRVRDGAVREVPFDGLADGMPEAMDGAQYVIDGHVLGTKKYELFYSNGGVPHRLLDQVDWPDAAPVPNYYSVSQMHGDWMFGSFHLPQESRTLEVLLVRESGGSWIWALGAGVAMLAVVIVLAKRRATRRLS